MVGRLGKTLGRNTLASSYKKKSQLLDKPLGYTTFGKDRFETARLPRGERFRLIFSFCLAADRIWAPLIYDQMFDSCGRPIDLFICSSGCETEP